MVTKAPTDPWVLDDRGQPVAVAFFNHGRWVAWCPRPGCMSAERFGPDDKGDLGGLAGAFRCRAEKGGCGLVCNALWPPNVEGIEQLLAQRPVPSTRNWEPGEELADLLGENLAHGILPVTPAMLEAGRRGEPVGRVLTVDDTVQGPGLEAGPRRRELTVDPRWGS